MKNINIAIIKFSWVVVICSLLFACTPMPIDIKVEPAPVKMVVFTQVIPDSTMMVTLTRSGSALVDPESNLEKLLVSGAVVTIKSNGQVFDFYEEVPGIYASYSVASFEAGQEFYLEATADGETISSTSNMLEKSTFSSISPTVEKLKTDTTVYLDFTFHDFPSVPNWYLINIYKKSLVSKPTYDASTLFANESNSMISSIIISDKEFDGTYHRKMELKNTAWNDSIVISLTNISEEYFNYLGYRKGKEGLFSQLNFEPLNYPTNIVNGYGFFNTTIPDLHFFDLSKY